MQKWKQVMQGDVESTGGLGCGRRYPVTLCMFHGSNVWGLGEEKGEWDTVRYHSSHFSLGWLESKCKDVLWFFFFPGGVTPEVMYYKQKISALCDCFAVNKHVWTEDILQWKGLGDGCFWVS